MSKNTIVQQAYV